MRFINRHITIFLMLFSALMFAQVPQDKLKAKIEVEKVENSVKITGTAENLTDVIRSAAYRLSVIKNNNKSNNQSSNDQVGVFTLQPNEIQKLSTSQINLTADDEVIILLLFYDEDKQIVAKDRVVLGEEKKKIM
ncbi:curli-like amyloid fiber formation chaperone CsgH [Flavobacterium sp.]|uniref:curli-like amyloid fiber formation chaperone CsgH n=1 Tax=Flavobacterium sp. TaxID=239 RepID=UPI0031E0A4F1